MDDEPLRYDKWIEDALRGVVRRALGHVASVGLPGEHHFYVTFQTDAEGVRLAEHLRAAHPDEMTIVLQHKFWDLEVGEDAFEVTLTFGGKAERLRVPYDAISAFADPSVNFGLQLNLIQSDDDDDEDEDYDAFADTELANSEDADDLADDGGPGAGGEAGGVGDAAADRGKDGDAPGKGQVIALDAFRKK
ncbi:MAG: hypothetical protein H6907_12090 [Hyphomicrobiales bacterium]|nr:hypothetical protein [Hyphomicrobiales bacterium]MCP5372463.1 hypothetical protein [Hyphomicrobiales bacterium]